MSLRKLAHLTGYFFLIIGALGYIPGITENNHLLGLFHVNTAHNLIHILTGLIAFGIARKTPRTMQIYFQLISFVYTAFALLGFYYGNLPIFGLIASNLADSWLHLVLGIAFLYIGFLYKNSKKA